ncbi:MAG: NTP transferase domain-containing protein, partial [Brachymonas sp.]
GLERCETPCLLTVPCDTPLFPLDLAQRLYQALEHENADITVASAPESDDNGQTRVRPQPVFCLLKTELMESLVAFMQGGGRKIDAWTALHRVTHVAFDLPQDNAQAFANVNTLQELHALEK